jgi:hypothetical protein
MTAITVGTATSTVQAAPAKAQAKKSLFSRAWAAFVQSRMQQAEREIALHRHLLPAQFESAAGRLSRSDDNLPFAR